MKTILNYLIALFCLFILFSLQSCSSVDRYYQSRHYLFITKKYCPHGLTLYTDNTCRDYELERLGQESIYPVYKSVVIKPSNKPFKAVNSKKAIKTKVCQDKPVNEAKKRLKNDADVDCVFILNNINQCTR